MSMRRAGNPAAAKPSAPPSLPRSMDDIYRCGLATRESRVTVGGWAYRAVRNLGKPAANRVTPAANRVTPAANRVTVFDAKARPQQLLQGTNISKYEIELGWQWLVDGTSVGKVVEMGCGSYKKKGGRCPAYIEERDQASMIELLKEYGIAKIVVDAAQRKEGP